MPDPLESFRQCENGFKDERVWFMDRMRECADSKNSLFFRAGRNNGTDGLCATQKALCRWDWWDSTGEKSMKSCNSTGWTCSTSTRRRGKCIENKIQKFMRNFTIPLSVAAQLREQREIERELSGVFLLFSVGQHASHPLANGKLGQSGWGVIKLDLHRRALPFPTLQRAERELCSFYCVQLFALYIVYILLEKLLCF